MLKENPPLPAIQRLFKFDLIGRNTFKGIEDEVINHMFLLSQEFWKKYESNES